MMTLVIGEPSFIVRKGFAQLFNEFSDITAVLEFATAEDFEQGLAQVSPDIIIANTAFDSKQRIKIVTEGEKKPILLSLFHSPLPYNSSPQHLSIFEDKASLMNKLHQAINLQKGGDEANNEDELSPREKLVLRHVALGKTNKEIADSMFISTHTVISHRKNITSKLGIKTVSGLTVYAILNKLIDMENVS